MDVPWPLRGNASTSYMDWPTPSASAKSRKWLPTKISEATAEAANSPARDGGQSGGDGGCRNALANAAGKWRTPRRISS